EDDDDHEEHQHRQVQGDLPEAHRLDHLPQRLDRLVGEGEYPLEDDCHEALGAPPARERGDHLHDDPGQEQEPEDVEGYVENQQDFTHVAMLLPTLSPPPTTAPVAGSAPEGTVDGVADLGLGEIHPGRLPQEPDRREGEVVNQQDFTRVAMLLPSLSPPPTTAPVAGSAPEGTVDGVADLGLGEIHPGRLQQERPLAVRYLLHAAVESEHQAGGEVHHAAGVPGGHRRQVEDHGTPGAEVLAEALAVTEAAGALDDGLGHGHQSVLDELVLGGQGDGAARGGYAP